MPPIVGGCCDFEALTCSFAVEPPYTDVGPVDGRTQETVEGA